MVLRKHLQGGRIVDIKQPDFERILIFYIESRDELGDLSIKRLIVEIMGRHSNIILVDEHDLIIDSVKRITEEISRVRQVLPGMPYQFPPSQNKRNPLLQDPTSIGEIVDFSDNSKKMARALQNSFTGVSKITAQEIAHGGGTQDLAKSFQIFFDRVKDLDFEATLLKDNTGRPVDVFPFPYHQYDLDLQQGFDSASEALEIFFDMRDRIDRGRQRSSHLLKVVTTNLERAQKSKGSYWMNIIRHKTQSNTGCLES